MTFSGLLRKDRSGYCFGKGLRRVTAKEGSFYYKIWGLKARVDRLALSRICREEVKQKIKPTGLPDRLDVGVREKAIQGDPKVFPLRIQKD